MPICPSVRPSIRKISYMLLVYNNGSLQVALTSLFFPVGDQCRLDIFLAISSFYSFPSASLGIVVNILFRASSTLRIDKTSENRTWRTKEKKRGACAACGAIVNPEFGVRMEYPTFSL
ncbi:hypothetical protein V8F33_001639 [Rhypophila sp. PSN 637]